VKVRIFIFTLDNNDFIGAKKWEVYQRLNNIDKINTIAKKQKTRRHNIQYINFTELLNSFDVDEKKDIEKSLSPHIKQMYNKISTQVRNIYEGLFINIV